MEITDVKIRRNENEGNPIKAFATITLDNVFAVRGIRVLEDRNGNNFISFPSREMPNGDWEDAAFPLSKELYYEITDKILEKYNA